MKILLYIKKKQSKAHIKKTKQFRTEAIIKKETELGTGIRENDPLSPLSFNIIIDEMISSFKQMKDYKIRHTELKTLCYADDVLLISNNESNLQKISQVFDNTSKKFH